MRKVLAFVLVLLMVASLCACSNTSSQTTEAPAETTAEPTVSAPVFAAGTYTASAEGKNGPVTISVTFSDDAIENIVVDSQEETAGLGDMALEQVSADILEYQSLAVDTVSGATMSSNAMLTAVEDCITQAGANPDAFMTGIDKTSDVQAEDASCDVLVIGGGGAGMTAAIFASEDGASNVILVEKQSYLGGNTLRIRGGMGSINSDIQIEAGYTVDVDEYVQSRIAGDTTARADMLAIEHGDSGIVANFFVDNGYEFDSVTETLLGTTGDKIVSFLTEQMEQRNVDIRYNTSGTKLLLDENGAIAGAEVSSEDGDYTIYAKSVVVATGGMESNNEMVAEYQPIYAGLGYISNPGNTGDGIVMAMEIGAQMYEMDSLTAFRCNSMLYLDEETGGYTMIGTYFTPGIVVAADGLRFGNEHLNYGFSPLVVEQDGPVYLIYNEAARTMLEAPDVSDVQYETIDDLAAAVGIDAEGLKATLASYQESAAAGTDEFGRTIFQTDLSEGPYYAVKLTPAMQSTFCGIYINENAEAIDTEGEVIPGLFAAGEVSGAGLHRHGDWVFGRIAGLSAIEYAKANS